MANKRRLKPLGTVTETIPMGDDLQTASRTVYAEQPNPYLDALSLGLIGGAGGFQALQQTLDRRRLAEQTLFEREQEAATMRGRVNLEKFKAEKQLESIVLREAEKAQNQKELATLKAGFTEELQKERLGSQKEIKQLEQENLLFRMERQLQDRVKIENLRQLNREKQAKLMDTMIRGRQVAGAKLSAALINLRSMVSENRSKNLKLATEGFNLTQDFAGANTAIDTLEKRVDAVANDPISIKNTLDLRAAVGSFGTLIAKLWEKGVLTNQDRDAFKAIISPGTFFTVAESFLTGGDPEIAYDRLNQARELLATIAETKRKALQEFFSGGGQTKTLQTNTKKNLGVLGGLGKPKK